MDTEGGKQRVNCVYTRGALRLVQSIPSPRADPFKQWLAQVGYDRVQVFSLITDVKLVADFVQKHVAVAPDRLKPYTLDSKGSPLSQRWVFAKLEKYTKEFVNGTGENRWVVMPGLRGAGKTTLLAQLYFIVLQKYHVSQPQLLYVPTDELVKLFKN